MAYNWQQPGPNPGMSAGGGNRNVRSLPVGPDGRHWSNGLFECSDLGTCVIAWFLPCVIYGQVKRRYEHLNTKGFPDPEQGGVCSSDCMLHGLGTGGGCGWIRQMETRKSIRQGYNIQGGCCGDCWAALCCTPCELTQESQELELEGQSFGKQG